MENQLNRLRVAAFVQLPSAKLKEVKQFVARCKRVDGYNPIFYWHSIAQRKNLVVNELLCYTAFNVLVGYLALYHFEENEVEITMMVDPQYRHPTFYAALLAHVKRVTAEYPIDLQRYVFTCNTRYKDLKEYVIGLGAACSQVTHKLLLTAKNFELSTMPEEIQKTLQQALSVITFRKASVEDMLSLMNLEVDAFQTSREVYKEQLLQTFQDTKKEIIVLIKNQQIIGKLHIQFEQRTAVIYDLCVATHEQGQCYGSLLLYSVLKVLFGKGIIKILVNIENDAYLQWYQKFHFKRLAICEHWKIAAHKIEATVNRKYEKQLENLMLNFHCYQVQEQLSHPVYKH